MHHYAMANTMKGLYFVTDRLDVALAVGADGIAIVSAICDSLDPFAASRELDDIIRTALTNRKLKP